MADAAPTRAARRRVSARRSATSAPSSDAARPSRLLALPEEVLGALLAFGDLRARYVGVVACASLRDAHARISPAHEHKLLARRYPILKTILSPGSTLSPRELYMSHERLFAAEPRPRIQTPVDMDKYSFSLELEIRWAGHAGDEPNFESIYAGTGGLVRYRDRLDVLGGAFTFDIPSGVWRHATMVCAQGALIRARVMAVRRSEEGRVECARLYQGYSDVIPDAYPDVPTAATDDRAFYFQINETPLSPNNATIHLCAHSTLISK